MLGFDSILGCKYLLFSSSLNLTSLSNRVDLALLCEITCSCALARDLVSVSSLRGYKAM